jgi:acyl-CoA reductase-like NAD-dependent aldehyde dehydrogenase
MLISLGMGRLDLDELATALEAAWANAFPGRETAERDAILREFIELLQEPAPSLDPARPRLRLITSTR